uniref:60S acidic ribosomal protein P0 n=1 Tax=Entamoeba histolytica TaxID=5759 RepID=S0AYC4_ENTHI|nr:60S acidic ribosomal protein P0, putative [Entamoeba histolytica]
MALHKAGLSEEQKKAKKEAYLVKMKKLLEEYKQVVVVKCDNVGSSQFQTIRKELRGTCEFVMGKNTLIRKAIKNQAETQPELEELLPHIKGNVGFIFTKGDLYQLKAKLTELKAPSPAKAGVIAPNDVIVPAGDTGLDPTQTNFVQALNIASKITKGQIEITSETLLIKEGEKVGVSQAVLLQKLKINPFKYGAVIDVVYDNGIVYDAKALDLTESDIVKKFQEGVQAATAISLAANLPTEAACPHLMLNAFQALLGFSKESGVVFPLAEKIFNNMTAVAATAVATESKTEEKKEEAPAAKEEEEEEDFGGFGDLF